MIKYIQKHDGDWIGGAKKQRTDLLRKIENWIIRLENEMNGIDKETYIGIVKFTLESMVDLAKSDKNYNLTADIIHYYETTIKPEMQISQNEFLELCKEAGIK